VRSANRRRPKRKGCFSRNTTPPEKKKKKKKKKKNRGGGCHKKSLPSEKEGQTFISHDNKKLEGEGRREKEKISRTSGKETQKTCRKAGGDGAASWPGIQKTSNQRTPLQRPENPPNGEICEKRKTTVRRGGGQMGPTIRQQKKGGTTGKPYTRAGGNTK